MRSLPAKWREVGFYEAFERLKLKSFEIPTKDYQVSGRYPIIDQGDGVIAGYIDREGPISAIPFIVFGDHTTIVKYVDQPCFIGSQGVVPLKARESYEPYFLYLLLGRTRIPALGYSRHFRELENKTFLLPPLAEQRKIAEILRTWDEAIETAEAELKAKQERKRWLMDKLLRLGTDGGSKLSESGWTAQRLGDILEIRHGKNQREVETPEGRYPILGTGGIIGRTNSFLYDKPSVLIGRKGTIDRPQYMETPFWTIDTLFYTSISDRALPRFIFYVFCTINWQQYNAATGVPSLAASTIESIKIQLPPLAEQRRIADILQAVDADAEVINCRIETLRAQKRGLIQKLLTGEVRVAA